jgi:hypothetical protein
MWDIDDMANGDEEVRPLTGLLKQANELEAQRKADKVIITKAYERIADPKKVAAAREAVEQVALGQLAGRPVGSGVPGAEVDNRPPQLIHKQQREAATAAKVQKRINFQRAVGEAVSGTS